MRSSQRQPSIPLNRQERRNGVIAAPTFLGGKFESEHGKLRGFLCGDACQRTLSLGGITGLVKCGAPSGEARQHGGCARGMQTGARGIDGGEDLRTGSALRSDEEAHLGIEQRSDGGPACPHDVRFRPGLSCLGGLLARPFQGTRHRSRSQPLPRSRSRQ